MSEMTASHFEGGQGATLVASAENTTRLPHGAKDPRGSEWINDRAASFDLVYGPEHDGKVAEDHFLAGGAMEATGNAEAEARVAERQRVWDHALAERAHADASYAERSHMGHEQVTTQNLEVVQSDPERNLLLVKGSVPGPAGGVVLVRNAVKFAGKAG